MDTDNTLPRATALSPGPSLSTVLAIVFMVASVILGGVALTQARWLDDAQREVTETHRQLADVESSLRYQVMRPMPTVVQTQHNVHLDWKTRTVTGQIFVQRFVDLHVVSVCGDNRYEETTVIPFP